MVILIIIRGKHEKKIYFDLFNNTNDIIDSYNYKRINDKTTIKK